MFGRDKQSRSHGSKLGGWVQNFYGISNASAKGARNLGGSGGGMLFWGNFEFLDSLERYFTYFRKSYHHKKPFLSRLMLLDRKNIFVRR